VPLCPPQIPHGLTRERTRASALRGQRLTACHGTTWITELIMITLLKRFEFLNRRLIFGEFTLFSMTVQGCYDFHFFAAHITTTLIYWRLFKNMVPYWPYSISGLQLTQATCINPQYISKLFPKGQINHINTKKLLSHLKGSNLWNSHTSCRRSLLFCKRLRTLFQLLRGQI
jgi:hypothetical protein